MHSILKDRATLKTGVMAITEIKDTVKYIAIENC